MTELLSKSSFKLSIWGKTDYQFLALKRIVSQKITDGPHTTPDFEIEGIPFISAEAIEYGTINFEKKRGNISLENHREFSKKCRPEKNDIFIVKSGSTTGKIAIVNTCIEFNIWSPIAIVRLNSSKHYPRYFFFVLNADGFQNQIQNYWSFGTQPNIGMNVLENLIVPCPAFQIQNAIANFLDKKTSQIDTLIRKKEEFIALLQEQRTALISQVVTKGLPQEAARKAGLKPNPKMKPSGVEWIGDIPEHWHLKRLKFTAQVNPSTKEFLQLQEDTEVSFVPMGSIGEFGGLNLAETTTLEKSPGSYTHFKNGDVLVAKITPCFENGKGAVAENLVKSLGIGTTEVHVLRTGPKLNNKFLFYLTISHVFRQSGEASMYGAGGQKRVPPDFVRDFKIPLPPDFEQIEIVSFLEKRLAEIDLLIRKVKEGSERLSEYKSSLIHAAVTGQIDVR